MINAQIDHLLLLNNFYSKRTHVYSENPIAQMIIY